MYTRSLTLVFALVLTVSLGACGEDEKPSGKFPVSLAAKVLVNAGQVQSTVNNILINVDVPSKPEPRKFQVIIGPYPPTEAAATWSQLEGTSEINLTNGFAYFAGEWPFGSTGGVRGGAEGTAFCLWSDPVAGKDRIFFINQTGTEHVKVFMSSPPLTNPNPQPDLIAEGWYYEIDTTATPNTITGPLEWKSSASFSPPPQIVRFVSYVRGVAAYFGVEN